MNEAEGSVAEEMRGCERRRRRGKWPIVLAAVIATIAAVFFFRQHRLNEQMKLDEQLRVLAGESGFYEEVVRAPKWYVKLAEKCHLPVEKRPLWFSSRTVTDEDMAIVGRATLLEAVLLVGSEISDAGMVHLEGLTKLQMLELQDTNIGDAGLAHLGGLTELRKLWLNGTKVSNAGLAHLKKLSRLQSLSLRDTEVADEGLALLSGFGHLNYLDLRGTQVTDAGLVHLKSLKKLGRLYLSGTHVTPEGVADLKSAIPSLEVDFQ